jgi:hypothetical protein
MRLRRGARVSRRGERRASQWTGVLLIKESGFREERGKEQHVVGELRAIHSWLDKEKRKGFGNETVRIMWRTSSLACAQYLKMSSRLPEVQRELIRIKFLEKELGVIVVGV